MLLTQQGGFILKVKWIEENINSGLNLDHALENPLQI